MPSERAWRAVVSDGLVHYDYVVPANWDAGRSAFERAQMIAALRSIDDAAGLQPGTGWLALAARLPCALRRLMLLELAAGNPLRAIGGSDWPTPGSVVVNFGQRFSNASQANGEGVCWRKLDDPHYCLEEISQRVDGIEYLLIA